MNHHYTNGFDYDRAKNLLRRAYKVIDANPVTTIHVGRIAYRFSRGLELTLQANWPNNNGERRRHVITGADIDAILDYHIDIEKPEDFKRTPLHVTAIQGYRVLGKLILQNHIRALQW